MYVNASYVQTGRIAIYKASSSSAYYHMEVWEDGGSDYNGWVMKGKNDAAIDISSLKSDIEYALRSRINNLDLGYSLDSVKFISVNDSGTDTAYFQFTISLDSGFEYSDDAKTMMNEFSDSGTWQAFGRVQTMCRNGFTGY